MTIRFSDGTVIDSGELESKLIDYRLSLSNYEEILSSLDDDEFIARGNGFCDRKYSDDFIEGQIAKYKERIYQIEVWLSESNK